ncbi:general secretion pathway protein GspB [Marinobacter bohaiensis]|uniref:general secretion pathway protein GspB n=1 Tax=Marinobacter bohaiensis TaxID=2201898 RepID=UPI000DAB58F6|nr:general secretion pathway protein GspB [Marinobacter bohaiensis]
MSYILDALRKSESDRQQGRVPDLAQSVQMIHKPRRRRIPVGVWVALALLVNAAVLAAVFWPGSGRHADQPAASTPVTQPTPAEVASESPPTPSPERTASDKPAEPAPAPEPVAETVAPADPQPGPATNYAEDVYPEADEAVPATRRATLIVPNRAAVSESEGDAFEQAPTFDFADGPPVEHLVEKPLSFQRKIPDLRFSSHIYASDPAARRVMINDNYLRPGDSFSGIRVEAITSDGVVLSAYGETFRVGVVRDWVSPR